MHGALPAGITGFLGTTLVLKAGLFLQKETEQRHGAVPVGTTDFKAQWVREPESQAISIKSYGTEAWRCVPAGTTRILDTTGWNKEPERRRVVKWSVPSGQPGWFGWLTAWRYRLTRSDHPVWHC